MRGGNPYRCKVCGCLAGSDGYCKPHRESIGLNKDIPMQRKNFIENYGANLGKGPFFPSKFGVEKKGFDIARKDFS